MIESLPLHTTPEKENTTPSFQEGDVVSHIDFGKGKVSEVSETDIWVIFRDEEFGTTQCTADELELLSSNHLTDFSIFSNETMSTERCSNEDLLENITLPDFRIAIIRSLEQCPNESIKKSNLAKIVLKELNVLTRGTVRMNFQKKIFKAMGLLRTKKIIQVYTTSVNERVRLTPSWKELCRTHNIDYSHYTLDKIKEKSLLPVSSSPEKDEPFFSIESTFVTSSSVNEVEIEGAPAFLPEIPTLNNTPNFIVNSDESQREIKQEVSEENDALLEVLLGESSSEDCRIEDIVPAMQYQPLMSEQDLSLLEDIVTRLEKEREITVQREWNKVKVTIFRKLTFTMIEDSIRNSIVLSVCFPSSSSDYGALLAVSGKDNFIATIGRTLELDFEVILVRLLVSKQLPANVAYGLVQQYISNIQEIREITDSGKS